MDREEYLKLFRASGVNLDPKKYILLSFLASSLIFSVLTLFSSVLASAGASLAIFFVLLLIPPYLARRSAKKAEAEIPWAALSVASALDAGMSMSEALSMSRHGRLGELFSHTLGLYKKGIPLDRALKKASEDFPSEKVKKLFMHLSALYAVGRDTDVLYKMAEETLRMQQLEAKRASSQIVLTTLAFVAVSSLIPSLFEIYVSVGSFMMEIDLSPSQIFTIISFFFPLFTLAVLLWAYTRLPEGAG